MAVPAHVLAQMSPQVRTAMITGAIVSIVLALGVLAIVVRNTSVNRRRKTHGQARLGWDRIADTALPARSLAGEGADATIEAALELRRQIEWEREQAANELSRYGRSQVRGYCADHDRWCKYPERKPHPPGGVDNERAPADWRPIGEGPPPVASP